MERKEKISKAFSKAFPYTIPIFAGFWFLGLTYGIYMNASGFNVWYSLLMSTLIFAGSMEFVTVGFLLASFNPIQAFLMTLMINARHLFYGISMLDRYRGKGWKSFYLIFGMCDESFSINYAVDIPKDVDEDWFMIFVTLLNQIYWVSGAVMGAVFGSLISINTEGIEFVMASMFIVIFMEQWMKEKRHTSSIIGLVLSILCRVFFGKEAFMIPAMITILLSLGMMKPKLERREVME